MRTHDEVICIHRLDLFSQRRRDFIIKLSDRFILYRARMTKLLKQFHACLKNLGAKRLFGRTFDTFHILIEEFEIPAVIEDEEELFVYSRSEKILPQTRAAADHLKELCLRSNNLEEDQIDYFRDINARV